MKIAMALFRIVLFSIAGIGMLAGPIQGQIADTFYVKLKLKTPAHPYYGQGSEWGYEIDGVEGKTITMVRDSLYAFHIGDLNSQQYPLVFTKPSGAPNGYYQFFKETEDGVNRLWLLKAESKRVHPDTLYYSSDLYRYSGGMILLVDSLSTSGVHTGRAQLSALQPTFFPNPIRTSGSLRLTGPIPQSVRLEIVDVSGRVVHEVEQDRTDPMESNFLINRSAMRNGVHFYRVSDADASNAILASGSFQVID